MSKNAIRVAGLVCLLLLLLTMLCGCGKKNDKAEKLTDEQALTAIRNYCYAVNPGLEEIVNAGQYPVYWDVSSSDEQTIVVLFRSYTGAQVRYYVNRAMGDTYVTEFVPGITPEEQRTEESFNTRDHLSDK